MYGDKAQFLRGKNIVQTNAVICGNSKCDHNTLKIHPNDPLNDCPDVEFALPSLGCPVLADVAVAHP